jgi:hypothetical protein
MRCMLLLVFMVLNFVPAFAAQPISRAICEAVQADMAKRGGSNGASQDSLVISRSLAPDSQWTPLSQVGPNSIGADVGTVYLAYVFNTHSFEPAGAVSVKMSVFKEATTDKTKSIELYRPAIAKGTNRCESRARRAVENLRVPINEYIDYHSRRGNSSTIEDFHISYPSGAIDCSRTDRPDEVAGTFQFPDVNPTTGDTLVARVIGSYIGQAVALNHDFSSLRSELHYYNRVNTQPSCVGFQIPLVGISKRASIRIHDLSSNWFSDRGTWLINRQ